MLRNKFQSGRSMIEMLGVLAIVGILSAGAISGYSMAMQSYKTNALIDKIQIILQQLRVLHEGDYTSIGSGSNAKLIATGMISDMKNYFGNSIYVNSYENSNAPNGATIQIYTYEVPPSACIKILLADWGPAFTGAWVNQQPKLTKPISKENAIAACNAIVDRYHLALNFNE